MHPTSPKSLPWIALLVVAACAAEPPPPIAPSPGGIDVLLVTIDTLRADRVGAYGDSLARTPNLDLLAARGALFREAHAVTPLTLPSHASILTGLLPRNHGLRDNAGFRLAAGAHTLAGALQGAGYETAAFVSAFVLDSAWGLDRGFALFRDPFHPIELGKVGAFGEVELPGAEVVNAAAAWWRDPTRGERPRFAWVHLYDPHAPWSPHPGFDGDPYRGEVAWADGLLGTLLRAVGDGALVVVTSDHGEGLWDHGEREHGVLLGRGVTRVPLIVRPPGGIAAKGPALALPADPPVSRRPAGADPDLALDPVPDAPVAALVVEVPVSGIDVAPTIADWAGATLPADGRSLRPLVEGGGGEHPPVYAETFFPLFHFGWSELRMVQDARQRVEIGRRVEVVRGEGPPLDALVQEALRARGEGEPSPGPVDASTAEALAALGYVTTSVPREDDLPDPRDRIDVLGRLAAAEAEPDTEARKAALSALVEAEPAMLDARISRGLARAASGDLRGALADMEVVLERAPDHPTALSNAAVLARELGRGEEALAKARRMTAQNPQDARGWRLQAAVFVDREDVAGVMAASRAGLAVAPEDPNLNYLLGLSEVQAGDPRAGVERLRAARRYGSQAGDIDLWLGRAWEKAGDVEAAGAAYRDATRSMPGDLRPWAMAGWMLYEAGRCEEAEPFLVNVARRGGGRDPKVREAMEGCGVGR